MSEFKKYYLNNYKGDINFWHNWLGEHDDINYELVDKSYKYIIEKDIDFDIDTLVLPILIRLSREINVINYKIYVDYIYKILPNMLLEPKEVNLDTKNNDNLADEDLELECVLKCVDKCKNLRNNKLKRILDI